MTDGNLTFKYKINNKFRIFAIFMSFYCGLATLAELVAIAMPAVNDGMVAGKVGMCEEREERTKGAKGVLFFSCSLRSLRAPFSR